MYLGWRTPQNGSGPLCGGIFWMGGERRLHLLARLRVGKMVVRTSEVKMVEARMAGYPSQVVATVMTAVAVMRVRGVVVTVQQ